MPATFFRNTDLRISDSVRRVNPNMQESTAAKGFIIEKTARFRGGFFRLSTPVPRDLPILLGLFWFCNTFFNQLLGRSEQQAVQVETDNRT